DQMRVTQLIALLPEVFLSYTTAGSIRKSPGTIIDGCKSSCSEISQRSDFSPITLGDSRTINPRNRKANSFQFLGQQLCLLCRELDEGRSHPGPFLIIRVDRNCQL